MRRKRTSEGPGRLAELLRERRDTLGLSATQISQRVARVVGGAFEAHRFNNLVAGSSAVLSLTECKALALVLEVEWQDLRDAVVEDRAGRDFVDSYKDEAREVLALPADLTPTEQRLIRAVRGNDDLARGVAAMLAAADAAMAQGAPVFMGEALRRFPSLWPWSQRHVLLAFAATVRAASGEPDDFASEGGANHGE